MKVIGNIIYIKVNRELYRRGFGNENPTMLKGVSKTKDALIQSSKIDYIRIINIRNERAYIRKLTNITRLICKGGEIMYLFQW